MKALETLVWFAVGQTLGYGFMLLVVGRLSEALWRYSDRHSESRVANFLIYWPARPPRRDPRG